MSEGLAEIRGWLVKGERSEGWLGICRILEESEASEQEMLVGYVAQHTKGWGESIRRPLYGWWEKHRRGEKTGFEGVVGDWTRYAWEEGRVAGEVREVASVAGMRMRWIPAGTFWMGTGEKEKYAWEWEKPKREVTLTRGFWMMETPVTQSQYETIMGEDPWEFMHADLDAPVEQVSWHDAAVFANKLSALEGAPESFVGTGEGIDGVGNKESDYVGSKGWRLPTEAEWEYACRAGTATPCYGSLKKIAWYEENIDETTHPVRKKQANAWGLYDMLGNVSEWCYDAWDAEGWDPEEWDADAYKNLGDTDPVYVAGVSNRVMRGGSWSHNVREVRAGFRESATPGIRNNTIGFRLVRL